MFLGLIFGKLIGIITKEEIKEGRRYFLLTEKVLLFIIILSLLTIKFNIFSLFILLGILLGMFLKTIGLFFGLGVFLSNFISVEFSLLISSLAFIYLFIYSRDLGWKKIFNECLFFAAPFGLFGVESFINGNLSSLLSISAGGLLAYIGPVAQLGRTFLRKFNKK